MENQVVPGVFLILKKKIKVKVTEVHYIQMYYQSGQPTIQSF
jgi:hypothetical protein